ncbi:unnamed protein product, partial [Rhizoctonia solani]
MKRCDTVFWTISRKRNNLFLNRDVAISSIFKQHVAIYRSATQDSKFSTSSSPPPRHLVKHARTSISRGMSSPPVAPSNDKDDGSLFDFANIDTNETSSVQAILVEQDLNSNENARQRRELLDLIIRLQTIGLGTELALPQIACIGSQSVGKSSLIESISGVALPRASGTCTRHVLWLDRALPVADQVTPDAPSNVGSNIQSKYGRPLFTFGLKVAKVATWVKLGRFNLSIPPKGPPMTKRMEVQERIRRAQLAILNPMIESSIFLNATNNSYPSSRSFSQNCVIVALSGNELSDLNFVDLPGLIANVADDKNVGDIELVKGLVTSYINRPSCLILLTISCENDFENQSAGRLAREYDPQGLRTIGVLTKPDRIESGSEQPWISMIKNETESLRLRHGWFSVKQPSAQQLEA